MMPLKEQEVNSQNSTTKLKIKGKCSMVYFVHSGYKSMETMVLSNLKKVVTNSLAFFGKF